MLIEDILPLESCGVLSLTGGGGKTSIMFHLARLLAQSGKRVLTTTTTRIFAPTPEQSETVLVDGDPQVVLRLASACLKYSSHVTAAATSLPDSGKLKGFGPEDINAFEKSGLFDWILVEADGAAGRSLKAPAEHEPVIPSSTTVLIAVAGLDVLGKPLTEDYVFRSGLAAKLVGQAGGETVTGPLLANFFTHPAGLFKDASAVSRRFIFLNKADNPERIAAGAMIAGQLRQAGGSLGEALIVGQALDRIRVHSVHSLVKHK